MDEIEVVDSGRSLTLWLEAMTSPTPVKGHGLRYDKHGIGWCGCGRACGGEASRPAGFNDTENRVSARRRIRQIHALHLVQLRHAGA